MTFPAASVIAVSLLAMTMTVPADASLSCVPTEGSRVGQSCKHFAQFDDDSDGVGGCVNKCKLDLEICLGLRPAGESPDRCEKLEDDCENACYNSGPDAGQNN